MQAVTRWHRRARLLLKILPVLYVASYFLLVSHETGTRYPSDYRSSKPYTYHRRQFAFDPWICQPLAGIEQRLRGAGSEVVLTNGPPRRSGSAIYVFGP